MSQVQVRPSRSEGPFLRLRDPSPEPTKDEWAPIPRAQVRDTEGLKSAQQRYVTLPQDDLGGAGGVRIVREEGGSDAVPRLVAAGLALVSGGIGLLAGAILF